MGAAYLDVEIDGNTALVWDHVRGCELYFFFFFLDFAYFQLIFVRLHLITIFAAIYLPSHIIKYRSHHIID